MIAIVNATLVMRDHLIPEAVLFIEDGKIKLAAEYIGMALMYDDIRFNRILNNNINIDDIVSYE